jgi:hypothetical protein
MQRDRETQRMVDAIGRATNVTLAARKASESEEVARLLAALKAASAGRPSAIELFEEHVAQLRSQRRSSDVFVYDWSELQRHQVKGPAARCRERLAAHRRRKARSTVPVRRRPPRVGSGAWPAQSSGPDLISLYAELSRKADAQGEPPR